MVVIGYDAKSFIIRNSWGSSWGEKGYINFDRSIQNQCYIAQYPEYPNMEVIEDGADDKTDDETNDETDDGDDDGEAATEEEEDDGSADESTEAATEEEEATTESPVSCKSAHRTL